MNTNNNIFGAQNTATSSDWTPDFQQSLVAFAVSKNNGLFEGVRVKWHNPATNADEEFNALQFGSTRVGLSRNLDLQFHDATPQQLVAMCVAQKDSLQVISDSSFEKGGYILCKRGANVSSASGSLI